MFLKNFGVSFVKNSKIERLAKFPLQSFSKVVPNFPKKQVLVKLLLSSKNDKLSDVGLKKFMFENPDLTAMAAAIKNNIYNINNLNILINLYSYIPTHMRKDAILAIIEKLKLCETIFLQEIKRDSLILLPTALESLQYIALIGGLDADVIKELKTQQMRLTLQFKHDAKNLQVEMEEYSKLLEMMANYSTYSQNPIVPPSIKRSHELKILDWIVNKIRKTIHDLDQRKYSKSLNDFIFLTFNLLETLLKIIFHKPDSSLQTISFENSLNVLSDLEKVFNFELELDNDILLVFFHFISSRLEELENLCSEAFFNESLKGIALVVEKLWLTSLKKILEQNKASLPFSVINDIWNKLIRTNFRQKTFIGSKKDTERSKTIYTLISGMNLEEFYRDIPRAEALSSCDLYFKSVLNVFSEIDAASLIYNPEFINFSKTLINFYGRTYESTIPSGSPDFLQKLINYSEFSYKFQLIEHEASKKLHKLIGGLMASHYNSGFFWDDDILIEILSSRGKYKALKDDKNFGSLLYDSQRKFKEFVEKKAVSKGKISLKLVKALLGLCGEFPYCYPLLEELLEQVINSDKLTFKSSLMIYYHTKCCIHFRKLQTVEKLETIIYGYLLSFKAMNEAEIDPLIFVQFMLANRGQERTRTHKSLLNLFLALYIKNIKNNDSNDFKLVELASFFVQGFKKKADDKKVANILKSVLQFIQENDVHSPEYLSALTKIVNQVKTLYQILLHLREEASTGPLYFWREESNNELICYDDTSIYLKMRIEDSSIENGIGFFMKKKEMDKEKRSSLKYHQTS